MDISVTVLQIVSLIMNIYFDFFIFVERIHLILFVYKVCQAAALKKLKLKSEKKLCFIVKLLYARFIFKNEVTYDLDCVIFEPFKILNHYKSCHDS
jgi:hypothetical protein